MRIRDLLRMWVAEQIFRKQIIIIARIPYPSSANEQAAIQRRTREHTGYVTLVIPDRANTGVTFEFLPTARKRGEAEVLEFIRSGAEADALAEFRRDIIERRPQHIPVG